MTPTPRRSFLTTTATLAVGVALGCLLTQGVAPRLRAESSDRWGQSVVACGPIQTYYDKKKEIQVPQDALYFLDYPGSRLLATVPTQQQRANASTILNEFAERDLFADFQLPRNTTPHFLMTVGSLGLNSDGFAPLFVFETTTKQIAVYRVTDVRNGASSRPSFDLLERKPIPETRLPAVR